MHVIFMHQLFKDPPAGSKIVIEPILFTGPDGKFKIHKAKIAYLYSCMYKYSELYKLEVLSVEELIQLNPSEILITDPLDRYIEKKWKKLFKSKLQINRQHPGFILNDYKGPLTLRSVDKECRRILGVLEGVPSHDENNRNPPDSEMKHYAPKKYRLDKHIKKAINVVNNKFATHVGDVHAVRYFPTTRNQALFRLKKYIKERLSEMKYQDAMREGDPWTVHSWISASLNVGLINPEEVVTAVVDSKADMSSKEGFVRQITGWRELMKCHYDRVKRKDTGYPDLPSEWYSGKTGIDPLDDCIIMANQNCYLHHILRLMVCLNIAVLKEFKKESIYKWFMEMVSIDAYDWVMFSNIEIMGKYDGNKVMRKPQISSSKYIKRMSNYAGGENENWRKEWDLMYYTFVENNQERAWFYKNSIGSKRHEELLNPENVI
ncbi:deoxyribodipyrimidine photolyase-related protein [Tetraselmis virus 1]|uniref:Deoxyribodipyrimidine photolyase-related protein n=1 Tax=Tetraselmis virus 1 TaxID=2060617 RepID=A0A2P0VNX8_9VIRU|nr:deoxyribodipyrimidine photolyase-related protein [Tetraselmis virus 1]AUF82604.1 deoxyribodipyrimidine photolyase-related protein [Tetraselmis virus 1]